jgi:DNA adenine methylase
MKTPLRYPGGKSRAVKTILEFIPEDCGELCSPFLGGGSVELALAERGVKIHGYEGFKPIVWFWQALLDDPERLADKADSYRKRKKYKHKEEDVWARGLPEKTFNRMRDEVRFALQQKHEFDFDIAAKVYAINRSSFSGATFSGGFSERASYARFTDKQIEYIRNFKVPNFTVKYADFKDSIKKHDCFFYLDPPYFLTGARSRLYGNEGDMHEFFPHLSLFSELKEKKNWILSYNDCEEIRHLYRDYEIKKVSWTYGMKNVKSKKVKEKKSMGESSEIIIIGDK